MEASERDRRITAVIHAAMLASVAVYGAVVAFYRVGISEGAPPQRSIAPLFAVLAGLGVAQLVGAAVAGRALLRSRRGEPSARVRLHFLLRAGAAEAVAIYAFALGFLGAPASRVAALFALGAGALLAGTPRRAAWARAMAIASGSSGGPVSPR